MRSFRPLRGVARACAIVAAALVTVSPVRGEVLPDFDRPDAKAKEALRLWEPERELPRIGAWLTSGRANAYLYSLHAQLLFHAGRYEEALTSAREAERLAPKDERVKGLTAFVEATLKARKGFRAYRSRLFELHLDPERDDILAEAALEAAERSHGALAPFFGIPSNGGGRRVRIEVYPTAERFQLASGLSRRDIEQTGAVGITAYNKVMMLSPRALTRGYRWADTLSHEYVHYLLERASKNNAPIWLHEGLAKFLETRWRSAEDLYLGPVFRTLLAEAVRDNEFVSFREMEPSLVRLPNSRLVQLAYAEGASAIDFILTRYGREKLLDVFRELASSPQRTVAEALRRVLGLTLEKFEETWKAELRGRNLKPVQGVWIPSYKVKEGGAREEAEEYRAIRSAVARNHLRLGDLLWRRGRQRPAVMEYVRAVRESPATPYLRNRLAGRLMAVGRERDALDQLGAARRLAPDYGPTYTLLGHVHLRGGRFGRAKDAYLESFLINPFDPSIHQGLALAYGKLGERSKAKAAEEVFRRLVRGFQQKSAPPNPPD
ncbi:MAG: peptidase MA family metallohydrolase [Nitrospinota bacterium]